MTDSTGISSPNVSTWDLLCTLGFSEDRTLVSDVLPGLIFDFVNFKLSAISGANRRLTRVILLTGLIATQRRMCEVECELPMEVESAEQGKAWVTWCLDDAAGGRFKPLTAPPWLAEGSQYFHLLPWKRRMAAYEARPHCAVDRNWARIPLRTLGQQLTTADDETQVILGFDGNVLTITCGGKTCPMLAQGSPWTDQFSIKAGVLRPLPTRLRHSVEFSIWDGILGIGNRRFKPVFAFKTAADRREAYRSPQTPG